MSRFNLILACLCLMTCLCLAGCGESGSGGTGNLPGGSTPPADRLEGGDWEAIVTSSNNFANVLYGKLAEEEGNLFLSPSSIHAALAMTYAGARGDTASAMHRTLMLPGVGRPSSPGQDGIRPRSLGPLPLQLSVPGAYAALLERLKPGKGYQLHVANALWGQKGYSWLTPFLDMTRANYGAGLREVDFVGETEAARQTINNWVEQQTKDKIKELLVRGILTPLTTLVLTNAIYFKGDWASQFREQNTRNAPFKLSTENSVDVPMMNQTAEFGYTETDLAQVLRLPYVGDDLSMVIFLPKKVDGLAEVEKWLSSGGYRAALGKLRNVEVIVSVPKFKMTSEFGLNEVLSSLGMEVAFTGAADFSGMNGRRDLFISAVVHKAFVDVNEKGTEAAAATAVVMSRQGPPRRPPVFRADHPFVFMIRHEKTGVILFMGRVADPT